jgi:peptide deformylase
MAIRKIARMGHPVLRQVSRDVTPQEIVTPAFQQLIQDMVETMEEYGGIGLAAPQIHESIQLAIIGFEDESERYPDMGAQPLSVFINPRITVTDPELQGFWEGCLSVPELRGFVERPRGIRVDYLDLQGKPQSVDAEGFLATVFQHELDHLAGKLFIDRIRDTTKLSFLEEYGKYIAPQHEETGEEELED